MSGARYVIMRLPASAASISRIRSRLKNAAPWTVSNSSPRKRCAKRSKQPFKARRDPNFVIIARTDSYLQVGLEEAIRRCRLFAEAGADLLMPTCVASAEDMRAFTQAIPDTPFFIDVNEFSQEMHNFSDRELETLGVKVVVHPMMSILHGAAALGALYRCYKECGSTDEYLKNGRFMPQREYRR